MLGARAVVCMFTNRIQVNVSLVMRLVYSHFHNLVQHVIRQNRLFEGSVLTLCCSSIHFLLLNDSACCSQRRDYRKSGPESKARAIDIHHSPFGLERIHLAALYRSAEHGSAGAVGLDACSHQGDRGHAARH